MSKSDDKYILIADSATWMSVHKGWIFAEAAKKLGYKTIRVAPDPRLSWQEDIFILDPLTDDQVLIEKLKKYKDQIVYILPTFDIAAALLAPVAQILEVTYLDLKLSKHLGTKNALASFLDSQGLGTPRTWLANSFSALEKIPESFPLVVKANASTGCVRKHDWDYKVFSDKAALLAYLNELGQLDAFLVNNQHNEFGQSVIQEYIEGQLFIDVHVAYGKTGQFEIYLVGEFSTHPRELHIVESKSAANLSADIQMQIKKFVSFLSENGCINMLANMQFVIRDEKAFLFDLNLRVAGIWSYLHKIMMPDFPFQALTFFAGKSANFDLQYPFYLKTPFYLEPGRTIDAIQLPTSSDETLMLAYMDHLVPGYTVPLRQNSIQPAPQIFAVGENEQDCRKKIQNFLTGVQVRYKS